MARLFGAVVLALAVAAGCDDGGGDGGADASAGGGAGGMGGGAGGGAGGMGGGADGSAEGCGLGPAENVGQGCTTEDECGPGGLCLVLEEAQGGACFALCIPGQCEGTCGAGQQCTGVTDADTGEPRRLDDGRAVGGCLDPIVGTAGAYEACGQTRCLDGLACLNLSGDTATSTCSPRCDGDGNCAAPDGFEARCVLRVGDAQEPTHCAILCMDTAGSSDCPQGLTCRPGEQVNLCLR